MKTNKITTEETEKRRGIHAKWDLLQDQKEGRVRFILENQLIAYPCEFHATSDDNVADFLCKAFLKETLKLVFLGYRHLQCHLPARTECKVEQNLRVRLLTILDRIPYCSEEKYYEKLLS